MHVHRLVLSTIVSTRHQANERTPEDDTRCRGPRTLSVSMTHGRKCRRSCDSASQPFGARSTHSATQPAAHFIPSPRAIHAIRLLSCTRSLILSCDSSSHPLVRLTVRRSYRPCCRVAMSKRGLSFDEKKSRLLDYMQEHVSRRERRPCRTHECMAYVTCCSWHVVVACRRRSICCSRVVQKDVYSLKELESSASKAKGIGQSDRRGGARNRSIARSHVY
jgi:hypothetical protein